MGLGFGGFVDGIVFHQILQWHHMLTGDNGGEPSNTVAGLEANTLADGFFHLATWILVAVGSWMLYQSWRAGRLAAAPRAHVGMLLAGWGIFNVVEGLIDHQILGIHHVRDDLGAPVGWDLGFLVFGVVLIVLGGALARNARPDATVPRPRATQPAAESATGHARGT
jgi:uncharacterized membrane protein